MKRINFILPTVTALLFVFLISPALCAPKQRVISLSPANTELAYAAGLGDSLIAVSAYSDYPEQAKQLEQVSDWQGLNVERIITLKPDLLLAWRGGNPQRPLDQLAALGIPIVYLDPQSIDDVILAIDELAQYSPNPELAQQNITKMKANLAQLKQQNTSNKQAKRVFIQLGTQPLFSAGDHTIQNDVVTFCGGENIFANSAVQWPQVSREQVLTRKPDVIVMTGNKTQEDAVKAFWHSQLDIPIIRLNEDWFHRAGPRIINATQALCEQLNHQK
ncbi:MAG TPA: vitamin B12 ABC transporter substrate-binding protein BtuF [Providencia sp.]|uniref:vitamin B12 ABC transporter substrate-binding protein BtuF n=1 Tax=Providencia sp. TaxID=589 RepID=UPI000E7EF156|nr:vitamin B12 ABC transporter substrate-binding protein BtuF [Providencia sp.]MBP6082098.1 vitamin B12 ABC transporter substrate-binding protein BtuF [Providencia sp.]HBO22543.1 vitamin B12 ABC transporter substrate-binding protein BtuF [Providencia sp.]